MEKSTLIQFNLYCDLAIEKLKTIKVDFSDAHDENSILKVKHVHRDARDSKYLFNEILAIINEKKIELKNLLEVDLT